MGNLVIAVIGVLGGIASGLFGLGGGAIFVPLLILLKHFDAHLAIGTSLAVIIPTAIVGVLTHNSAKMVDWKAAIMLSIFAILGAWLGSALSLKLDTLWLKRLFAAFLILTSLKLFFSN